MINAYAELDKIFFLFYCRILLVYPRHTDSRMFRGHLRQTYCQHSLHRQTWLLVGSHSHAARLHPTVFNSLPSFVRTADSFTSFLVSNVKCDLICITHSP